MSTTPAWLMAAARRRQASPGRAPTQPWEFAQADSAGKRSLTRNMEHEVKKLTLISIFFAALPMMAQNQGTLSVCPTAGEDVKSCQHMLWEKQHYVPGPAPAQVTSRATSVPIAIHIGPGQTYTNIGDAPLGILQAGDTVYVHTKPNFIGVTASASTGTALTLTTSAAAIPYGSTVSFAGFSGSIITSTTCGQYGSGLYGAPVGGTACAGNTVTLLSPVAIGAGVTVYFQPPYFEKLMPQCAGTAAAGCTIQGVPDPLTGALPILDAHNSTTGPNQAIRSGTKYHADQGSVVLTTGANGAWPTYLTIANLRIQNAVTGAVFYDASGTAWTYDDPMGIYLQNAEHIFLSHNEIVNNTGGVFGATNGPVTCNYCDVIDNVSLIGNHLWLNAQTAGIHQSYMEAANTHYIGNHYDTPGGMQSSQLKDRGPGTVIMYNEFEPSIRELDLDDAQNSFNVYVPQVDLTVPAGGFAAGETALTFATSVAGINAGDRVGYINNLLGWGYPGAGQPVMPLVTAIDSTANTLTLAAPGIPAALAAGVQVQVISEQLNPYQQVFVAGNVFNLNQLLFNTQQGAVVHCCWDTANGIDSVSDRAGTVYFGFNTVVVQWDQTGSVGPMYHFPLLQTESDLDQIRLDNNIFMVTHAPGSANPATYFVLEGGGSYTGTGMISGVIDGGSNQIVVSPAIGANASCGYSETGWTACNVPLDPGSSMWIYGFTTESPSALYPAGLILPYALQPGSSAIGAASPLPAAYTSNTLSQSFVPALNFDGTPRTNLLDLGAQQYSGVAPPPPPPPPASTITGVTVLCTPASITSAEKAACVSTVTGTGSYSPAVTWSQSPNGFASISNTGVFTPPGASSWMVTATSAQDPTKSGLTMVTVTPTPLPPPAGAIAYVNGICGATSYGASGSLPPYTPAAAGNTLVLSTFIQGTAINTLTAAPSTGIVNASAVPVLVPNAIYGLLGTTGPATFSYTLSAASGFDYCISEYSGVQHFGATATGTGTSGGYSIAAMAEEAGDHVLGTMGNGGSTAITPTAALGPPPAGRFAPWGNIWVEDAACAGAGACTVAGTTNMTDAGQPISAVVLRNQ